MAIDPSIPLSVRGPQGPDPLSQLATVMNLRALQEDRAARRRAEQQAETATQEERASRGRVAGAMLRGRPLAPVDRAQVLQSLATDEERLIAQQDYDAFDAARTTRRKAQQTELALAATTIRDRGYDPQVAEIVLGELVEDYPEAEQIWQQMQQSPEQFKVIVDAFAAPVPTRAPIQWDPQKPLVDPVSGRIIKPAESAEPDRPKPGTFEFQVWRQYGPNPTPAQVETARRSWAAAGREADTPLDRQLEGLRVALATQQVEKQATENTAARETRTRQRDALNEIANATLHELDRVMVRNPVTEEWELTPGVQQIVGKSKVLGQRFIPGTKAADAFVSLQRVKSRLVVDLIREMKAQSATGATGFGQLSDKERELLESAAARLDTNQTDAAILDAVLEIRRLTDKSLNEAGTTEARSDTDKGAVPPAAPPRLPAVKPTDPLGIR